MKTKISLAALALAGAMLALPVGAQAHFDRDWHKGWDRAWHKHWRCHMFGWLDHSRCKMHGKKKARMMAK